MRFLVTIEIETDADEPGAAAVDVWRQIVDPSKIEAVMAVIEMDEGTHHHFPLHTVAQAGMTSDFRMWSELPGGDQFPFGGQTERGASIKLRPIKKKSRKQNKNSDEEFD